MTRQQTLELARHWAKQRIPAGPIAISWDERKQATNKRPLTRNGHLSFTTDLGRLDALFGDPMTTLITGEVYGVGLHPGKGNRVVLDVDVKGGKRGDLVLAQLEAEHGALLAHPIVDTASGGTHDWFAKPEGVHVGNADIADGVEVRADDGWVVAPGTVTPWGSWTIREGTNVPAPPWPDWLAARLNGHKRPRDGATGRGWSKLDRGSLDPRDLAALAALEALGGHGAVIGADGGVRVTRPGKKAGPSASVGYLDPGVVKVFTDDWAPLRKGGVYSVDDLEALTDGGPPAGSASPTGSAGSQERGTQTGRVPETGAILDETRDWFERFVCTVDDTDLDLLTLWAAHTHLCMQTYTTPRLLLDSPVPGSGKTTVLEHFERLCHHPVQMAVLSSPALLTRMLDAGLRTILIDEADRSLNPDKDGVADLLAVLNSGYKRGGTRPVLIPTKDGWQAREMPTFAPVVMAGNNPNLPDDTRSRMIRVLLMPDIDGTAEESDWEVHDEDAREVGRRLGAWADCIRDEVRTNRPDLPDEIRGRARERWSPLKRVAAAGGGRWPQLVDHLAVRDVQRLQIEREDGLVRERPAVALLRDIHKVWPEGQAFMPTDTLLHLLVLRAPHMWGSDGPFGKALTAQRLGRMLVTAYNIHSDRSSGGERPRGYLRTSMGPAFRRSGLDPSVPREPAHPAEPAEPAEETTDLDARCPDHGWQLAPAGCPQCPATLETP